MDLLDQYLTGNYLIDQQELNSIEKTIHEASATLVSAFVPGKGWPYQVKRKESEEPPDKLSQSTTTMVSLSLWKLLQGWTRPAALPAVPEFPPVSLNDEQRKDVLRVAEEAISLLEKEILSSGQVVTGSGSYGEKDPITLSFLADLTHLKGLSDNKAWESVRNYVRDRAEELGSENSGAQERLRNQGDFFLNLPQKPTKYDVVANAIIPLRVVQAMRTANNGEEQDMPSFREYFETTLHDQLSFSSIPDSRFDPAELAFCLEGLLLSQPDAVDRTLFARVLEVLTKAQEESAFWRPNKPFMATNKGFALFPVSVEVANSLLRSCEIYDGPKLHDTFGSASLGLFRRYWQWLRARTIRFTGSKGERYVGWHSEHVNETGAIHVWETSQVLEFLLAYHRLLQAHIARTTLILSRFSIRQPKESNGGKPLWEDQKPPEGKTEPIDGIRTGFEPAVYLGPGYEIYQQIYDDFIKGWLERRPANYSMLLYGPPGTGKTTVAENIADALGYRMITITVSDFLAGGGVQLEARAKAIFDVLLAQSNCVVLFDEIDNFLLDRDSERYTKQDSAFQFMTPGMLTKLNDLRRAQRVLFVVATNYENRIDPAIKRTGRIDKRYLVLPPDGRARQRMLTKFLGKTDSKFNSGHVKDWKSLQRCSLFLGFKDIQGAVADVRKKKDPNEQMLCSILSDRARTTTISMYASKIEDDLDRDKPIEEVLALIGLALEVQPEKLNEGPSKKAVQIVYGKLADDFDDADMPAAVKLKAPGLSDDIAASISRVLKPSQ